MGNLPVSAIYCWLNFLFFNLINFHFFLLVPPSIARVVPEIPPGQSKYVNKGESLTLACEAKGHPEPKVTWTKRGHNKHFPDGKDKMEGTSITFEEVDRKYSGIYECEASNAYGTMKKSFEIHVHCELN